MRVPLLLFVVGLLIRLLFWQATADRDHAWAAAFAGDAPVWQQQAAHLANSPPGAPPLEELRLPLRPPGTTWLVALLWDGQTATAWRIRLVFVVLGASVAPLLWLLLRPAFGGAIAAVAAGICALATNLVLIGSGPHNELPYLLGFLCTAVDHDRVRNGRPLAVARWSLLHALLCLLRSEHVLTFVALLGWTCWRQPRWRRTATIALAVFAAALVPWHVTAWRQIDDYNQSGQRLPPPGTPLPATFLPWDEAALARVRALPAFQQVPVFGFVTDTVRVRGGRRVTAADLGVVDEAYGWWPEPLPRPFLALYGGLNFFLGNAPESAGGFSTRALQRQPQLLGGPGRYPPGLTDGLPTLALSYPPHLQAISHGYALGLRELTSAPLDGLLRIGTKLAHAWQGAAIGIGGYNAPIGLSGTRRPVDFVVAGHLGATLWRWLLAAGALAGLLALRRHAALVPWLLWAGTKVVTIAAFFGYARQGALLLPVVAILLAGAWDRWLRPRWSARTWQRLGIALLVLTLAAEAVRSRAPGASLDIDGAPLGAAGESPREHETRVLRYDW